MFNQFKSRLDLRGTVDTVTAIRIGAGRSTSPIRSDLPVVRDALDRPYIPGSSFKGVLRSYIESVLRNFSIDDSLACDPTGEADQCVTKDDMNQLRGARSEQEWNEETFTEALLKQTCWVCQLFGSPWYASKLQVRDLTVRDEFWFGQYLQRNGVAIDRDTETASEGRLYDYEAVPAGVPFDFRAIVDNAEDWQLGMLYFGLAAFEGEQLTIGGATSRGLGVTKLSLTEESYLDRSSLSRCLTEPEYRGEQADRKKWAQAFRDRIEAIVVV